MKKTVHIKNNGKQYTLKTMNGDVTGSSEVLIDFIFGYFAIAERHEKVGNKMLASMYREKACEMFNELGKLERGEV